jgi:nucleotide-binding universal stress UspA family protein
MIILVPTDFSKLSKVAVLYAARIAKKLKANVILLTVMKVWRLSQDTLIILILYIGLMATLFLKK